MVRIFAVISILLIPVSTLSQEKRVSEIIISIAEQLASDEENPGAVAGYVDRLYELSENPVDINSASETELSRLFFISEFQLKSLKEYIRSSGNIVSVYELANIPGFDVSAAEMIMPFCTLENGSAYKEQYSGASIRMITNLSVKPGENDSSMYGSPWKALTRVRVCSGAFSAGITAEKDPGEKLASPLPDFLSAYLSYTGRGFLRNITAGDYSLRFGHGTNINTSFRPGLSLTSPGYMSAREELKPYTSSDENNFFRGIAADFAIGDLGVMIFCSSNKIDASVRQGPDSIKSHIESFYTTGTHNTATLLQKKDAVAETSYGMNVSYTFREMKIGVSYSEGRFSLPVDPYAISAEEIFDFRGRRNTIASVYYTSLLNRFLLFGELSLNDFRRHAIVQGLSFRPSDRLTINLLYRNYAAGYFAFHGNGPGTAYSTSNEAGLFGNFIFEAAKHLFISGGCDAERYPWLRYRCSSPSWGMRHEIRIRSEPSRQLRFEFSYYRRMSMTDVQGANAIACQEQLITNAYKGVARYAVSENLSLSFRVDYRNIEPAGSRGFLMLHDLSYSFKRVAATLWFRYCLFNTDDWDSRIYTYENDLLYSFSIPAFSGEGSRSYLMAKWDLGKRTEVRLKYGISSFDYSKPLYRETDEIRFQLKIWI